MSLIEYLKPLLTVHYKVESLKYEYRETLNKYLPESEQIPEGPSKVKNQVEIMHQGEKDLSLRRYQAIRSFSLNPERPNILESYMELIVQFGYVVLFSVVFPLGAFMSLVNNHIKIRS